jgi:hypothetical protein
VNRDRPRATLRCPQCGFKVPLGDRQYAELQRRLRVVVPCPRCRLTFPYSAIGERSAGPAADSTVDQPAAVAGTSSAPDLVLPSDGPFAPQVFAPTAEGPLVVQALETDIEEEGPCLTIVESESQEPRAAQRSPGAVWRSLSAPVRWLTVAALVVSLGLIGAAVIYRVTSAPPGQPPDSSGAR